MSANTYSDNWFEYFLIPKSKNQEQPEKKFLNSLISSEKTISILDIGCGDGRYLSELGKYHKIVGIDTNEKILNQARVNVPDAEFIKMDMRELDSLRPRRFDLILSLWQSFGYFTSIVNLSILESISNLSNDEALFVLDIYNPEFFEKYQGEREFTIDGVTIIEKKMYQNNRLTVELNYPDNSTDVFDWQLYSQREIIENCDKYNFKLENTCTNFDKNIEPTSDHPRIQYVFKKT